MGEKVWLKRRFKDYDVKFVDNSNILDEVEKMHLDLYLMTKCKHYAVIPSAFNWWGAWLSNYKDKHVIRPKDNYFKHLKIMQNVSKFIGHFINGQNYVDNGTKIDLYSPCNGELIGIISSASDETIDKAIKSSETAFYI